MAKRSTNWTKKVCGILQEIIAHEDKKFMIVGVGINTLVSPVIFEPQTTNLSVIQKKVDNNKILKDIKKIMNYLLIKLKNITICI